jgi:predicted Ser/Thr protein kinase
VEDRTVFQPVAFGSVKPGIRFNGIYEIVAFVTQGGMGEVYRGFNIQTGDSVAIKMIRPELTNSPDVLELFKREAKTLHKLAHEAIVRYFVFTVDPDTGRAYLAMEFVDGPSLTKRIESGPLPLTDVKILQTRIGSALEAAHRLGVIHRDVSPDNIILPDGDVRNAKVIDFGIARSLKRAEVTIIGGGFAGKYNYASPEQFGLAGGEVTFKSDIYSFGLILAAALRGRPIHMSGSEVEAIAKRRVVPDLSDIDPTIRPLIQGMLQPLPADRPVSMAAVAAWAPGDSGSAASPARGAARPLGPASGRATAMLGAVIALASVGGAAYVFHDEIAQWAQALVAPTAPSGPITAPPLGAQIPPLTPGPSDHGGAPSTTHEPTGSAPTTSPAPPSGAQTETLPPANKETASPEAPNTTVQHVPTSAELLDDLPPRASQSVVDLPAATVGAPYRAELPAFDDRGGKGLQLAANALPEGMTFRDLGEGRGEIEGTPTQAGSAALQIVAINHDGKTAQMSATLIVADRTQPKAIETPATNAAPRTEAAPPPNLETQSPPPANGPVARLEPPIPSQGLVELGATAGVELSSDLPRFRWGANPAALALHAEPEAPPGLAFADLGSGLSRISGSPTTPGPYAFDVIATEPSGGSARMTVKLVVLPPPAPSPEKTTPLEPPPPPTSQTPKVEKDLTIERGRAFVAAFDGGDCFLIKLRAGAAGPHSYQAFGRELETFQRFDSNYKSKVGAEADLRAALISAEECPALDLIRLGTADGAASPRIELTNYGVGRGKPLAGAITNLAGRHLYVLYVDNAGVAHKLNAKMQPGGGGATFSVPLTPDTDSIGAMQILLAIVSSTPIPAMEAFREGRLTSLASQLVQEARGNAVSVEADYFKFSK